MPKGSVETLARWFLAAVHGRRTIRRFDDPPVGWLAWTLLLAVGTGGQPTSSSARISNSFGMDSPSNFAVLRLSAK